MEEREILNIEDPQYGPFQIHQELQASSAVDIPDAKRRRTEVSQREKDVLTLYRQKHNVFHQIIDILDIICVMVSLNEFASTDCSNYCQQDVHDKTCGMFDMLDYIYQAIQQSKTKSKVDQMILTFVSKFIQYQFSTKGLPDKQVNVEFVSFTQLLSWIANDKKNWVDIGAAINCVTNAYQYYYQSDELQIYAHCFEALMNMQDTGPTVSIHARAMLKNNRPFDVWRSRLAPATTAAPMKQQFIVDCNRCIAIAYELAKDSKSSKSLSSAQLHSVHATLLSSVSSEISNKVCKHDLLWLQKVIYSDLREEIQTRDSVFTSLEQIQKRVYQWIDAAHQLFQHHYVTCLYRPFIITAMQCCFRIFRCSTMNRDSSIYRSLMLSPASSVLDVSMLLHQSNVLSGTPQKHRPFTLSQNDHHRHQFDIANASAFQPSDAIEHSPQFFRFVEEDTVVDQDGNEKRVGAVPATELLHCRGCMSLIYYKDGAFAHQSQWFDKNDHYHGNKSKDSHELKMKCAQVCGRLICGVCYAKQCQASETHSISLRCLSCNLACEAQKVKHHALQRFLSFTMNPVDAFTNKMLQSLLVQCSFCTDRMEVRKHEQHMIDCHAFKLQQWEEEHYSWKRSEPLKLNATFSKDQNYLDADLIFLHDHRVPPLNTYWSTPFSICPEQEGFNMHSLILADDLTLKIFLSCSIDNYFTIFPQSMMSLKYSDEIGLGQELHNYFLHQFNWMCNNPLYTNKPYLCHHFVVNVKNFLHEPEVSPLYKHIACPADKILCWMNISIKHSQAMSKFCQTDIAVLRPFLQKMSRLNTWSKKLMLNQRLSAVHKTIMSHATDKIRRIREHDHSELQPLKFEHFDCDTTVKLVQDLEQQSSATGCDDEDM